MPNSLSSPNNSLFSPPRTQNSNNPPCESPRNHEHRQITSPVPEEDEFLSNSASSVTYNSGLPPSANSSEVPPVSDASESQLHAPAHDFAFYEWDFQDTELPGDIATVTVEQIKTSPHPREAEKISSRETATRSSPKDQTPVIRSSIEELMRPSIYKSQLSRELGTTLAAELHSDMFGGIPTESFASRERTRSTGVTDTSIPAADEIRQQPISPIRRGGRLRYHTIAVMPPFIDKDILNQPARDVAFSDGIIREGTVLASRSQRRSRTADFHYDRGSSMQSDRSTRRQRSVEVDRGSSFRKLLHRLSSKKKK